MTTLAWVGQATAQPFFTDITETVGLDDFVFGGQPPSNVVFVDYNNDGFQDVFFADFLTRRIGLLQNTGDGRLIDMTSAIPSELHTVPQGGILADYDNDGDEDLYLAVLNPNRNLLLRNDRGLFTKVTWDAEATPLFSFGFIWLDYDRDGHLDLYVDNLFGNPPRGKRLFRNNGAGLFVDRTAASGLDSLFHPQAGGSFGGMAGGDFNNDGWPDLYIGAGAHPSLGDATNIPNRLFLSDGQGGFVDATTSAIADEGDAFDLAVGDINNDGDLDIFQAVIAPPPDGVGDIGEGEFRNLMLLNLGDGQFLDVSEGVGLGVSILGANAVGAVFADVDNDGDLDLVIGFSVTQSGFQNFLLLNDGSGSFTDATNQSGIDELGGDLAVGDFDEDGFVDLFYPTLATVIPGRASLYRNNGNNNHWLRVELVGVESNRNGIGARLFAEAGDLKQMREILGGLGRNQSERVAHFGLAQHTQVDRLEIRWPSGQVDVLANIPADRKIRVFEGREGYHVAKPTIWERRPPTALVAGSTGELTALVRPALFGEQARITRVTADLSGVGGPMAFDLSPEEEGTYRLNAPYQIDGPNRVETVWVSIEQATSLGPYWTKLSAQIEVWPAADLSVFGDESAGWALTQERVEVRLTHDDNAVDERPTGSPDGSSIMFISDRDGDDEIYVMDADGTNQVNLTNHPGNDRYAVWSPDGTRIAFHRGDSPTVDVYVMDADGGNPMALTNRPGRDTWPTWSPDGTRIAFSSERDGNSEIYVMNADGTNVVRLTEQPGIDDRHPRWSPDGSKIAFESERDGDWEIYVMNTDGSNQVNLTNSAVSVDWWPNWSPDGSRIAFHSSRDRVFWEIYVMNADGSGVVRLTDSPGTNWHPSWSPDGTKILFDSDRAGNFDIYSMEVGEGALTALDPEQMEVVFEGDTALEVIADGDWSVAYAASEPHAQIGYHALRLALHPGDVTAGAGNAFRVALNSGLIVNLLDGDLEGVEIDLTRKEWQSVEIPLSLFGLDEPVDVIKLSGSLSGRFYLDDIRLVRATPEDITVVEEEEVGVLPEAFTLDQNYPNPFNSGTVIRFALHKADDVELAIYNLAGQRVVNLAQGPRNAGSYTLRWDGRDDAGRELASGMYLYRLQAGEQLVETRKMLLIR